MPIEVSAGYRLDDRRPAVEVQSTISTSPGKRLHWLTPDEAREMAEDLMHAAGEVEGALRRAPQGEGRWTMGRLDRIEERLGAANEDAEEPGPPGVWPRRYAEDVRPILEVAGAARVYFGMIDNREDPIDVTDAKNDLRDALSELLAEPRREGGDDG